MVVVKCPVQLGFPQKSWIEEGRTEEVECEGSMGDEAVPEMQVEFGVVATEAVDGQRFGCREVLGVCG